jgi:NAD(P)-dependent dehydrogenase (short-subunit alcohol dehydrogenase family)
MLQSSREVRLTQHVAAEGKESGISAFAIEPGTVFTELAAGTIASPEAQRWLPGMMSALQEIKERDDPAVGLARCGQMCVELASGRFDGLSGSYLTPQDDFADLLQRVRRMRRTGSEHASDRGSTLDGEQA